MCCCCSSAVPRPLAWRGSAAHTPPDRQGPLAQAPGPITKRALLSFQLLGLSDLLAAAHRLQHVREDTMFAAATAGLLVLLSQ